MKLDLGKIFFLILFLTLSVMAATAGTIKGTITDRQTKEPLTGATVQVSRTVQGAVADLDGNYTLELKNGTPHRPLHRLQRHDDKSRRDKG